jgi:Dolichyl-phosphate-mannose-protein mannosyltransferase
MRIHVALAAFAGLTLRVFFVLKFPVTGTGDSPFYIELAWNWLKKGVYGFTINGQLAPVDMRVPGYPAFLAAIFTVADQSVRAAMLAQAVLDTAGCFVIALIAARLAPESSRRRVTLVALWLAALCPFMANYCAAILTETLVIFLTALALLVLLGTELGDAKTKESGSIVTSAWFLGGIVAGFGTLVRPETPLLLIAVGLVLAAKWWRPSDWGKLARAGLLMGAGLLLPLVPWAARNWNTLHEVQFLAPRHSELPGEYTPLGFSAWTDTWLWRYRDVYRISWKADNEEIFLDDIPAPTFDSADERAHVEDILERYNETETIDPALDNEFRELARERTARHPLRTYLKIPALRALSLWFTPRIELLPFTGPILPLRDEWREDRRDLVVTTGLFLLNLIYVVLAIAGAWAARARPGIAFLIVFILVRTVFFTCVETPEPRYMLECYPAVIALAAQVFAGKRQLSSTGSG